MEKSINNFYKFYRHIFIASKNSHRHLIKRTNIFANPQSAQVPSFCFSRTKLHLPYKPDQANCFPVKDPTIYPLTHEIFSRNGQTIYPYAVHKKQELPLTSKEE